MLTDSESTTNGRFLGAERPPETNLHHKYGVCQPIRLDAYSRITFSQI